MITAWRQASRGHAVRATEFGEACPLKPKPVTGEATKGKRIVIFGLPGAYTPTCSAKHVPGYLANLDALKAKGVDEVWCVSVNDGYVMAAWGRTRRRSARSACSATAAPSSPRSSASRTTHEGGMGMRMRRFSMLVEDGVVKQLNVEEPGKFEVSDAETMLTQLG